MGSNTENALAFQPGMIFQSLDNGDMIMDWDSGDFVPIDQVIRDPWHIEKIDILDQDGHGSLRFDVELDDPMDDYNTDDWGAEDDEIGLEFDQNDTSPEDPASEPYPPLCKNPTERRYDGGGQNSRTVSVRKQSYSRNKRGKIRDLH